jgi:hypothetical protein
MKSPKKKDTDAKFRNWRVAIMRSRAHQLGDGAGAGLEGGRGRGSEGVRARRERAQAADDSGAGVVTGKNRIMIYGPKDDGTYVVEFMTAEGDVLAISIPRTEAHVIRHFQERMPYGLFVPGVAVE